MTAFQEIERDFLDVVSRVVYATMTTVDGEGRPRARVLLPVWEVADGAPVGWLATFRTPVKTAHLSRNPHTTLSYWSPAQHTASADAVASWAAGAGLKRAVWNLYREGSPPGVGYDPQAYWAGGPDDPDFHVLRLDPWRIQVQRAEYLAKGRPARIWTRETRTQASAQRQAP